MSYQLFLKAVLVPEVNTTRGRLQREADFTGAKLVRFREVFVRHGAPVLLVVVGFMVAGDYGHLLMALLAAAIADPYVYLALAGMLLSALLAYGFYRDGRLTLAGVGWTLYLLALSAWEETLFRVVLPALLDDLGLSLRHAILASSVAFGALHYFTLRWKWQWCLLAALGGLAFSYQLQDSGDLARVILLHWLLTFLNTPRPPGSTQLPAVQS